MDVLQKPNLKRKWMIEMKRRLISNLYFGSFPETTYLFLALRQLNARQNTISRSGKILVNRQLMSTCRYGGAGNIPVNHHHTISANNCNVSLEGP